MRLRLKAGQNPIRPEPLTLLLFVDETLVFVCR